ncbi:MAG: amidohydrolase family protein [Patescibacteria group bacterium]
MIIDAHTHIYDDKKYRDYQAKAKDRILKMIVLGWYKDKLVDYLKFADTEVNLFFTGSVDMDRNVAKQLKLIEKTLKENKIYGVKLYPGYQYFFPSDEKVYPIAELCQKYDKPLIFHSGDVWNPEGDAILKYSHPIYIDELAVKFPKCKMIISHFGFPYILETVNVVSKNKNVFTEISGTIEKDKNSSDKETEELAEQYIKDLKRVFAYFPGVKKKTMFGTDYGGENTPLNQIEPYMKVVESVFTDEEQKSVFGGLAERLFFE